MTEVQLRRRRPIARLYRELRAMRASVVRIEEQLLTRRRDLSAATRREHLETIAAPPFNGLCPSCLTVAIVDDAGARIPDRSEYDHWHQAHLSDAGDTWLICTTCHAAFTYGRLERSERTAEWVFYQRRRAGREGAGQMALVLQP